MNHFDLLAPINPELSAGAIFSFFVFVVTLLVGVAAGLIVLIDGDRRLKKFKLNIFHGFLIFFLFSLLLVMGRFLWSNSYLYEGELSYIQYEDSVKVYEGESIVYEDVVLKPGDTVNDYAWAYEITGEADVFNKISFLEALFNAALYLAIPFIGILLFWLVFYALGALFYNWGKKPSVDLSGILFSIGIGAALMSFFGFGLALVGLFYPWPFLLLAGVSLVLGKRHVQALYVFCKKKLAIPLKKISWLSFGMGAILLLLLSISFVLASASVPSGFDDFGYYMNLPNLIANTHGFVHYYGLYGFAILQAVAISFQGTTGLAQVLTFSFGVLSLLLIYVFTAAFLNKKLAFFMAVVLATVPFFAAHSSIELKVELPLLFYGGLSFLSFYYFTKKNQTKWLVLSGLMAGFAVLIKLTAVLLVFALVFLFFSYYWKLRGGLLAGSIILFVISFLDLGDYGFMKETGLIVFGVISVIGLIVLGAHVLRKDKKLK
ncbi:phospholipid carrier-dependent glycosyltransferase, partial [bacterium]|nr:phospholipid carrier-dependent glycosyltransferase [bacterium]